MEITHRDIFDSQKLFPKSLAQVLAVVESTGYAYICFNGLVRDLDGKVLCEIGAITKSGY